MEITEGYDSPDTGEASGLIMRQTWRKRDEGFDLFGIGFAWTDNFKTRVASGAIKLSTDQAIGFDFESWSKKEGPIILSKIRSPRK